MLLESVLEAPAEGSSEQYRYGLPRELLLAIMSTLLGFIMLVRVSKQPTNSACTAAIGIMGS